MQDEKDLPAELSTCHEVILVQSGAICDLSAAQEKLKQELAQLNAYIKKILAGNRNEKLINPDQRLLEFPEDTELQAALEAAKREAEQVVQEITYTRGKRKEKTKSRDDSFPAHFPRVEVAVAIPADKQKLLDEGKLIVLRYEPREVMCHKAADIFIKRYMEPVFATPEAPEPWHGQSRDAATGRMEGCASGVGPPVQSRRASRQGRSGATAIGQTPHADEILTGMARSEAPKRLGS